MIRNPESYIRLGKKFKTLRIERKLLQVELAVEAGINPNHYSKIERGRVSIRCTTFVKIAKALQTDPNVLFLENMSEGEEND